MRQVNIKAMNTEIFGRKTVIQRLERLYSSKKAEFITVYGRRRVGKTFLVRELFAGRMCFYHTGISPVELSDEELQQRQLTAFYQTLNKSGAKMPSAPKDWFEAFEMLRIFIESLPKNKRQVVFIDEMPWMSTPRSGFITAFENFWNGYGAGNKNLMLIVCGSAASWMSENLINNYGGLYNRLTAQIHLHPFTLDECKEYYKSLKINIDKYSQIQSYMIFGGVPYYLSLFQKGDSLAQTIDRLFFAKDAELKEEFDRLYRSLFKNYADCIAIVQLLAKRRIGYTRKEIAEATKLPYGGGLTKTLKSLELSDFIVSYIPYGQSSRQTMYRLVDFFSIFYLTFVDGNKTSNPHFWSENQNSPKLTAWRGFSFEGVCFAHIDKIKSALGISGVNTEIASWKTKNSVDGAQIDMLIDRADNVINLCEIKFYNGDFVIDKAYDRNLRNKIAAFTRETTTRKSIHLTLITTYGLAENEYFGNVQKVITMEDLV